MIETQIIDNALKSDEFQKIQEALLVGNMFPWFWNEAIAGSDIEVNESLADAKRKAEENVVVKKPEKEDNYYFTNTLYNHFQIHSHETSEEEFKSNKEAAIQQSTLKHWPIIPLIKLLNPSELLRVKANLYLRTEKVVHHDNHIDFPFENKGAILYVNTNNGLTVLEDGTECESVANRLLLFDTSKPHHSTTCNDQKRRVNINVNFM